MKKQSQKSHASSTKSQMIKVTTGFSTTEAKWLQKQSLKSGKSVSAIVRTLINKSNKSIMPPTAPKTALQSSITVTEANVKRLHSISSWSGLTINDAIRGIVREHING